MDIRNIYKIGVVGAGAMGTGIPQFVTSSMHPQREGFTVL